MLQLEAGESLAAAIQHDEGQEAGGAVRAALRLPVSEFPSLNYSKRDVRRAGDLIAGTLHWDGQPSAEALQAFRIANNWRDSHAYPMRSVRGQILAYMRKLNIAGVTGARLKRMQAIRRKLRRTDLEQNLTQLQDLGGCRAILPSIRDVRALTAALREHSRHHFRYQDDYIAQPKPDGYRGQHLIYAFEPKREALAHKGRRIEIQLRTRLQHSWATAVESVGLFRGEYLKGQEGSEGWLRLFQLMSAEIALAEGCPEPANIPARKDRVIEIRQLNGSLRAIQTLENLSYAVRGTEEYPSDPLDRPTYYLIKFDNTRKVVDVSPYSAPKSAIKGYDEAEAPDNISGHDASNIVLVEADKIDSLKDAYPNYFGDVQLFKTQLSNVVHGKTVEEYTVRPLETVKPRPKEKADLSWFRRPLRWRR